MSNTCFLATSEDGLMCLALLDGSTLNQHASIFVVTIKKINISTMLPPFDYNSTSWLWQRLKSNEISLNEILDF
jgi:hypothetical protein